MHLIFDSETSGFAESRLLQLGCQLYDREFRLAGEAALIVKPDFKIEEGATKVHGITQEYAEQHGFPIDVVLSIFAGFVSKATTLVGHNLDFDLRILTQELQRHKWPVRSLHNFCTMQRMTDICRIPPTEKMVRAGRREFKRPSLAEAYKHAFNETFDNAHDAMADCRATARLYRWLISPAPTSSFPEVTEAISPNEYAPPPPPPCN